MIDLLVKLLLLAFAVAVGGCFAIWPMQVIRRFGSWRGRSMEATTAQGPDHRIYAQVSSLRQIGILLIALTFYLIYLWIRTG